MVKHVGLSFECGRCPPGDRREVSRVFTTPGASLTRAKAIECINQARAAGWANLRALPDHHRDHSHFRLWACPRCAPIVKRRAIGPKRWAFPR